MDPSEIAVALARIEGKLDLLHAQGVAQATTSADHENRIRALETRPVVTPRALMGALTAASLLVGTVAPFLVVTWS